MPSDTPDSSDADDADVETDLDAESADHDGTDDDPKSDRPFTPPGFLDALKTVFRPNGKRERAQPATGTAADAMAVNFIDRRERLIAGCLSGFQILYGIVVYLEVRRYVERPSTKTPKISIAQAHAQTLSDHHNAPIYLAVNLVLGLAIAGGILSKRRALVGVTVMLAGFGLSTYGGGIIGLLYLGIGIWLVFRAMRRTPSARAAAGARTGGGGARGRRGSPKSSATSSAATAVRKPPAPSKRYTPPSTRRPALPKPAVNAEPEKESRLTSWLRR
jgi:hypothetical protein